MVVARIHPNTSRVHLELDIPPEFIGRDIELDMHTAQDSKLFDSKTLLKEAQAFGVRLPAGYKFNREDCYNL
jgi:hypothetical protein